MTKKKKKKKKKKNLKKVNFAKKKKKKKMPGLVNTFVILAKTTWALIQVHFIKLAIMIWLIFWIEKVTDKVNFKRAVHEHTSLTYSDFVAVHYCSDNSPYFSVFALLQLFPLAFVVGLSSWGGGGRLEHGEVVFK